jgi:hypothetical protein
MDVTAKTMGLIDRSSPLRRIISCLKPQLFVLPLIWGLMSILVNVWVFSTDGTGRASFFTSHRTVYGSQKKQVFSDRKPSD